MWDDRITPEECRERLTGAVVALASLDRTPQERLDRALSLFRRAFRGEPDPGPAYDAFRRVYQAIGDPPYGTPLAITVEALSPAERDALGAALVDLLAAVLTGDAKAAPAP